jgi:DNA-binding MarR family transcriptional regulator
MRVLTDNTGKGQLEIISILAQKDLKQKGIVEEGTLSKGSVSANVKKLEKKDLVNKENSKYSLDLDKILELYREHLETFLIRKDDEPNQINEVRTKTKEEISSIFEENSEDLKETLRQIISSAGEREDLESINSIFKEVDRVIRETEKGTKLELIGISTDLSNSLTQKKSENIQRSKEILQQSEV